MARPKIGDLEFLTKEGPSVLAPLVRMEDVTRPRVDGHAWRDMGARSGPVQWVTEADVDNADETQDGYEALQGELVTVTDDDGRETDDVMVLGVQITAKKKLLNTVGGLTAGAWMVTAVWTLQGS